MLLLTALHWAFGFYVGFQGSFTPLNVLLNALMIRSDINGVMWSMTVECFASPLILLSFFAYRWRGAVPLVTACVILFGLSFWGGYVHFLGGVTNLAPLYGLSLACCYISSQLMGVAPGAFYGGDLCLLRPSKTNGAAYPHGDPFLRPPHPCYRGRPELPHLCIRLVLPWQTD